MLELFKSKAILVGVLSSLSLPLFATVRCFDVPIDPQGPAAFRFNDPEFEMLIPKTWSPAVTPVDYGPKVGRGFISSVPPFSPEAKIEADKRAIMSWGQKFIIVESFEEAEHILNLKSYKGDPLMAPLFVIGKKTKAEISKSIFDRTKFDGNTEDSLKLAEQRDLWAQLHSKPINNRIANDKLATLNDAATYSSLFFKNSEGRWEYLPQNIADRFSFDQSNLMSMVQDDNVEVLFYQRGWFLPPFRGVVVLKDYFNEASKERRKDVLRKARKLKSEGIIEKITFNTNIRKVIELIRDQKRVGQDTGDASKERYKESVIQSWEKLLAEGKAYCVEVWNKDAVLVGGGFGTIENGLFEGESVGYPVLNKPNGATYGIEVAQIMKYALFDVLHQSGFQFQDSGMATAFTKSIGGAYIPVDHYLQLLADARLNPLGSEDVNWPNEWKIPEPQKPSDQK
jgi:Leu/Phe-tRNA-protein transferase